LDYTSSGVTRAFCGLKASSTSLQFVMQRVNFL
jgi:hypothetical protein